MPPPDPGRHGPIPGSQTRGFPKGSAKCQSNRKSRRFERDAFTAQARSRPGILEGLRLLQSPVSLARLYLKLRPTFHRDANRMKLPGLAAFRLEAEDVLAMHLFAHQLNGLLQSVLL